MEKAIMKNEITLDFLRFKLANIINSIDKAKKENNLSVATVNEWISVAGLQTKKSLEELASEELLKQLVLKIKKRSKKLNNGTGISAEDLGNLLCKENKSKNNPSGYFEGRADDIRALEGIKYQEGKIFEKAYNKIWFSGKFLNDVEMFGEFMRLGFILILEKYVEILKNKKMLNCKGNLKISDLKLICNEIAKNINADLPFGNYERFKI